MRSIIPQFVVMLLILAACHKHEDEILPVPPPEDPIAEAPPEISEDENDPPVKIDSAFFESGVFRDLPYRILKPRNGSAEATYPMLVFLHGIGERGTDNEQQLNIGGSYFLSDSVRERYPAFVVYPQCPTTSYWFDDDIISLLKGLIDSLQALYAVDKDRISLGGFSMGAYGTFEMVSRFPRLFEAAVAISGDGDKSKAGLMARSRWKIFAGERDDIVPSGKSKKMAEALARAGASVSFTLYPGADHGSTWMLAFSEPGLLQWLFRDKKPAIKPTVLEKNNP